MQKRIHVKIAEMYFEKMVACDEVVHHIDGDRSNNDPENLIIMKQTQHSKLHGNCLAKQYGLYTAECCSVGKLTWFENDNRRLKKEIKSLERLNKKLRKAIDFLGKQ